jgi:membrane-associated phospholipid phosphatase
MLSFDFCRALIFNRPVLLAVTGLSLLIGTATAQSAVGMIEPGAGKWKTWVISSGDQLRVSAPPDAASTKDEIAWLHDAVAQNHPSIVASIPRWDAGAPTYPWIQYLNSRFNNGLPMTAYPYRLYALVSAAMYDATIAAWDSKYAYNRPRPSDVDSTLATRLPNPRSPSYPSEYAAVAAAASEVLAYLLPSEAESFRVLAQNAGMSRLYAGVDYPTDYFAGLDLGRAVAAKVIERAKADGSDFVWSGSIPQGPGFWVGTNPGNVNATNWKTFVMASASEFRPPPPPAWNSAETAAELAVVRNFPRTDATKQRSFFWQSPQGLTTWWYDYISRQLFESKQDQNPPRAARAYALMSVCMFDTFTASQDGKFTYWYARPHMLDQNISPLFTVPNFPSYPSNHSSFSANRAEVLAYLFPWDADYIKSWGADAGNSRIWAGIHYQFDNVAGNTLGKKIADKCIAWASQDGSQ